MTNPSSDVLERLQAVGDNFESAGQHGNATVVYAGVATIERLSAELERVLPKNVCLTNANVPDSAVVALETTMGDLRRIRATLSHTRKDEGTDT